MRMSQTIASVASDGTVPTWSPRWDEDDGERVDRRDADRADGDTHHDPDQDRERAEAQEQDEPAMRTSPHAHT